MERLIAIGVDGARAGWLAACGYGQETSIERVELQLVSRFSDLEGLRTSQAPVLVDVPMGLLDVVGLRPCDQEARAMLGRRANSVFAPPSRPLLEATSYTEARQIIAQLQTQMPEARGLSAQAFGIAPKIREAELFLREQAGSQKWLLEYHPEASFRALAGGTSLRDKKSVGGQAERFRLVLDRFPRAQEALERFEPSGRQAELTEAKMLGGQLDSTGLAMRIVF